MRSTVPIEISLHGEAMRRAHTRFQAIAQLPKGKHDRSPILLVCAHKRRSDATWRLAAKPVQRPRLGAPIMAVAMPWTSGVARSWNTCALTASNTDSTIFAATSITRTSSTEGQVHARQRRLLVPPHQLAPEQRRCRCRRRGRG